MKKTASGLAIAFVIALTAGSALASGTLWDNAMLMFSFPDFSGSTRISADNDGTYIWTASGGGTSGQRLAKYDQSGVFIQTYAPGIDFRSLFVDNNGQLYAKEYGAGNVYTLTQNGVPTLLFTLNDPESQSAASLNDDDSEMYTMSNGQIRRYNSGSGAFIGSFPLIGWGTVGTENAFPDDFQMETNATGRILTYTQGIVSEWDLGGNRVGQCNVPTPNPGGFETTWSFAVSSDGYVYLYNEVSAEWEVYDVGLAQPTPVEETSWGRLKKMFSER